MTAQIQFQSNDWLVFIEGVQVPFINFTYSSGVNMLPTGSIQLIPDSLIANIRPNAVVSLFFRDPYVGADKPIEDQYVYYGGGEIISVGVSKQPQSKSITVTFRSEFGAFAQHRMMASGVGGSLIESVVSGSTLYQISNQVNPNSDRAVLDFSTNILNLKDARFNYGSRVLGALAWFSAHNASLRLRTDQHQLLSKFMFIDNTFVKDVFTVVTSEALFNLNIDAGLSDTDSVLDVIYKINAMADYKIAYLATPSYTQSLNKLGEPVKIVPTNADDSNNLAFSYFEKSWERSDGILMPNMHYFPPPPCNYIFPDMVEALTYSRTFESEPTRSRYTCQLVEATGGQDAVTRASYFSVDSLPNAPAGTVKPSTPSEFYAAIKELYLPPGPPNSLFNPAAISKESPFITDNLSTVQDPANRRSVNSLFALADSEITKGVITETLSLDGEYLLALAAANRDKSNPSSAATESDKIAEKLGKNYSKYVQSWVDYRHGISRFNRTASVSLKGHKWLAPGFSAVIFDQDVCLWGMISSVSFTADASGNESTQVDFSNAKPITGIPQNLLDAATKLSNDISELTKSIQDTVKSVYDASIKDLDDLLASTKKKGDVVISRLSQSKLTEPKLLTKDKLSYMFEVDVNFPVETVGISPVIKAYNDFAPSAAILIATARNVADKMVGPSRELAGALAAKNNPELATDWLATYDFSIDNFYEKDSLATTISNLMTWFDKIASLTKQSLEAQKNQALAGQPYFASTAADADKIGGALVKSGRELSEREAGLRKILNDLERNHHIPDVPKFYPTDFTDITKLDRLYTSVLGTPKFYERYVSGDLVFPIIPYLDSISIMFGVLKAMYTDMKVITFGETRYTKSKVGDWVSANRSGESTMDWQHQNILRRGHMTLKSYLNTHGFESSLRVLISGEPTPTFFYAMTPYQEDWDKGVPVLDPTGAKTPYTWDQSCLTRLISISDDPAVKARRAAARDPSLSGSFRQEQIINYSRKLMGSRAYRGD